MLAATEVEAILNPENFYLALARLPR